MKTQTNIEKLKAISKPSSTNWLKVAEDLEENEAWLDKSAKIAFSVLSLLREKQMTKQDLADKMGVKPQYISRIVKGTENLTLETISKLESALGTTLIEIAGSSAAIVSEPAVMPAVADWKNFLSSSYQSKCLCDDVSHS